MPGWRAWVDGRPAMVERANALFIGAEVPAGTHRVEFRFLPTSVVIGVSLSALTCLFIVLSSLMTRAPTHPPMFEPTSSSSAAPAS